MHGQVVKVKKDVRVPRTLRIHYNKHYSWKKFSDGLKNNATSPRHNNTEKIILDYNQGSQNFSTNHQWKGSCICYTLT